MRLTFLIYALIISFSSWGQKAVPELWNLRVHDDAHVLKQETIDQLEKKLTHYEDSTSNQIAILIISSLEGESLEEYSIKVADKWELGKKDKDNGVLLLIAVDDHKMRIEVGEGLEGVLTDAMSSRIIRNEMAPNFRRGDFDSGVTAAIDGIIKAIGGEYSAEESESINVDEFGFKERLIVGICLFFFFGIFAFFALVTQGCTGWGLYAFLIPFYTLFFAPLIMNPKIWYVPGLSYILGFPLLKLWVARTNWGKKIGKNMGSGSSGGGSRGWSRSSWSSGSSSWGSSSGGGFSGGGGSFGGGGSSGSW